MCRDSPRYGFLSENAAFARRCADSSIVFIGPRPELLDLFGNKLREGALAERCGVPVLAGTEGLASLDQARHFYESLSNRPTMIKAVAGGGGRGMRAVHRLAELDEAYRRCQSEARTPFGADDVCVERLIPRARHIEVQIVGDGSGFGQSHMGA